MGRLGYHYEVNGEVSYSQGHVQSLIKKMKRKPIVK
jgi:hypothetical protein